MTLRRSWANDTIQINLPKRLVSVPLADDPNTVAFMDGPVVLAGLNPGGIPTAAQTKTAGSYIARPNYAIDGIRLVGDKEDPTSFLTPDNEREWTYWRGDFRTKGQERDLRLIPLYEVRDEVFSVYFGMG